MNELPVDIIREITGYLKVQQCLRLETAIHRKVNTKEHYVDLFSREPLLNRIRLFRKGVFRTYEIYSYIKDGVTYSDVTVSPICRSFRCKHSNFVTPSMATHWVLSCITDRDSQAASGIIKPMQVVLT